MQKGESYAGGRPLAGGIYFELKPKNSPAANQWWEYGLHNAFPWELDGTVQTPMKPAIKISETGRARLAACLIEDQILARLRVHRKQTFLAIADSLPEYDWRSLLMALNRLRERGRVQLSALRWDYEVVLLESSRSPRRHPLDEQART